MDNLITRMLDYPYNGGTASGYFAAPGDDEPHPGVIVIQEWWGLVPHIADVTRRFARAGFAALAPDLYHGQSASEPDGARKLAMEMDHPRAIEQIHAAAQYLTTMPNVQPKKVGVVGWCMGGGLAISSSIEDTVGLIGAVAVFYGRPRSKEDAQKIHAPLLGIYGAEDKPNMDAMWVKEFGEILTESAIPHHLELYPGAGHAFFNDTRQSYRPEAAQDAWRRTLAWFQANLK